MVTLHTTCFSVTNLYILPTQCIISQNNINILVFVKRTRCTFHASEDSHGLNLVFYYNVTHNCFILISERQNLGQAAKERAQRMVLLSSRILLRAVILFK